MHVPQMYRDGGVRYISHEYFNSDRDLYNSLLNYCQNREWTLLRWYFYFWKRDKHWRIKKGGRGNTGAATPLKIQKLKQVIKQNKKNRRNEKRKKMKIEKVLNVCLICVCAHFYTVILYLYFFSLQPPPLDPRLDIYFTEMCIKLREREREFTTIFASISSTEWHRQICLYLHFYVI